MQETEQDFSFKNLFVPFTTLKAITWIIVIGFIVYFNSLFNGFVWDDLGQVVNNNAIHSLSSIISFFFGEQDINGNIIKIHASFYRPLMESLYTIVYSLFGLNAFFYHSISLLMQIAIVICIYFFLRPFFKQGLSFIFALIILIHPMNAEAVDYIGAYNDLLYLLFGMLCVILLKKTVMTAKRLLTFSIFLFLSLISKESGFLFIPVILIYSFLLSKKNLLRISLACVITIIVYVLFRASLYIGLSEEQAFGFSPFLHMSFLQHLENIPKLFTYYIFNFIYPSQLAIAQQWSVQNITFADFYLPAITVIVFIAINIFLIIRAFKKKNNEVINSIILFSLWFWFGVGLYFQLIPLDMTVADRWFYFPMIGLLGMLGVMLQEVKLKKVWGPIIISLVIIYISFLSARTIIRNTDWNNEKSLYMHDITVATDSFDLENLVGMIYFGDHNTDLAKRYFQKSIALYHCSDAVNNLGYVYQLEGKIKEAEKQYFAAVQCSHGYKDYGNLILLLYRLQRFNLAEQYAKEAIQKFPNGAGLYFVLGVLEYQQGDKQAALKSLETGYRLSEDPEIANAYQLIEQNKPAVLPEK